jgi:hypothetical protein
MRIAPQFATAIFALSLPALMAPALSAEVTPAVLQELRQKADAAFKASVPAPPKKTPEQVEAEKKSIKSHCDALFARMAERDNKLPNSCS